MGVIVLVFCITSVLTFFAGMVLAAMNDSEEDTRVFSSIIATLCFIVSAGLCIGVTHEYVEKKEYSSTKYNLKKKVITTEEDNIIKLDTIYTFKHK